MKAFYGFGFERRFPAWVYVDENGNILIRGTHLRLPTRQLLSDESCRNLVNHLLKMAIGARPVLVTYREACKLYALAWLLADLVPSEPMWAKTIARFAKRSARAARFWEHATIDFDCAETSGLFRALVFAERSRATLPNRVVIDRPDIDVFRRAIRWKPRGLLLQDFDPYRNMHHYLIRRHIASLRSSRARQTARVKSVEWAGVICSKPATVLLVPADCSFRPVSWCSAVVTNIADLRISSQKCRKGVYAAVALERLADRIAAADPSASAHSLIAMQGPLLNAAEELQAVARSRRE